MDTWKFAHCSKILSRCKVNSALAMLLPWVPEVFFLVGGDRIERRSREGESRSGEKKNLWHQRITTSLPCRHQFPLIDIHRQSLFQKHSKPVLPTWSKIFVSCFMFTFHESLCLYLFSSAINLQIFPLNLSEKVILYHKPTLVT